MWINAGPNKNGISQVYSPRVIVTGETLEYDQHYNTYFGQYIYTNIDPDKSNGMKNCTFPGIYLGPTGNMQGTVNILTINTRKVEKRLYLRRYPCQTVLRS